MNHLSVRNLYANNIFRSKHHRISSSIFIDSWHCVSVQDMYLSSLSSSTISPHLNHSLGNSIQYGERLSHLQSIHSIDFLPFPLTLPIYSFFIFFLLFYIIINFLFVFRILITTPSILSVCSAVFLITSLLYCSANNYCYFPSPSFIIVAVFHNSIIS